MSPIANRLWLKAPDHCANLGKERILLRDNYQEWTAFLQAHVDGLFQTALLAAADPELAEESVAKSFDAVDIARLPAADDFTVLQTAVIIHSLRSSDAMQSGKRSLARVLLQPDLWPILEIERPPRFCFILRVLLRNASSSCAQILGTDEDGVTLLLRAGVLQLHEVTNAGKQPNQHQNRLLQTTQPRDPV